MKNIKTLSELRMEKHYCKQLIIRQEQTLRDDTIKAISSFKQQLIQTVIREGVKWVVLGFLNNKRKKKKSD